MSKAGCKRILNQGELENFIRLLEKSWMREEYGEAYLSWLNKIKKDVSNNLSNYREAHGCFAASLDDNVTSKAELIGGYILNSTKGDMVELKSFISSE